MKKILLCIIIALNINSLLAPKPLQEYNHKSSLLYYYDKEFFRWSEKLGMIENSGKIHGINHLNRMGKYQMSHVLLSKVGFPNVAHSYRDNHDIFPASDQYEALKRVVSLYYKEIRPFYPYVGKDINGTKITVSGLLAAIHLGGYNSLSKYIRSNGKININDGFTHISDYIRLFAEFNLDLKNYDYSINKHMCIFDYIGSDIYLHLHQECSESNNLWQ